MGIGLALTQVLKLSELRAVMAHEVGRYHGGDVKLGPLIYRTREALVRTVTSLAQHSGLLTRPFVWYAHLIGRSALARGLVTTAPRVAADRTRATEEEIREGTADPYDTHPTLKDPLEPAADEWAKTCAELGIDGVELGTVRDALHGG